MMLPALIRLKRLLEWPERAVKWRRSFMMYHERQRTIQLQGIEEGKEIGIKIGEKQNQIDTAKKLLLKKMPIEFVMEITGLSALEIKDLEKQLAS